MSRTNLLDLPAECLSHILSLTSPTDIILSSAVSKQLLSASESDFAWEKFLPSDTDRFISLSSTPFDQQHFASKKDLYFRLCTSPILLNTNNYNTGGKKSYMLGARTLKIAWVGTSQHCNWKYVPEWRFLEIVELQTDYDVCCRNKRENTHQIPLTKYNLRRVFCVQYG